jgi:hypothetical protein
MEMVGDSSANFCEKIFQIKPGQLHNINWAGFNYARRTFSAAEINLSIKLTINWLSVGTNATRCGDIISHCHRCQQPETLEHLFNCHQNSHNKVKYIDTMSDVLKHANSDKDIAATLVHGLSLHLALESTYQVPQHLQYCYDTQTTYGWHLVCSGLLIQQWSQHQQQYHEQQQTAFSHLTGDIWNRKISESLIRQAHKL